MYVGVILMKAHCNFLKASIPHVCGGDPDTGSSFTGTVWYSPCMWG